MPGVDLQAIVERLRAINAPDQGMNYSSGDMGRQRYDEETGAGYWTGPRPATLSVYGDRARFLYDLIRNGPEIADAIASAIDARSDATGTGAAEGESATAESRDAHPQSKDSANG